jgi:hypothetical protein
MIDAQPVHIMEKITAQSIRVGFIAGMPKDHWGEESRERGQER